jgi:hypothetical protein
MTQFVAMSGNTDWKKQMMEGWEALKAQHKDDDKAMRFNEGKLQWGLVEWKSMEPMVEVLMFGAQKYAPDNWKKGQDRMENLESAMRHLMAMMRGEILDPESGKPHVGHLMCCAMFNSYFDIVNPPGDNEHLFDTEVNE